eukprot:908399-Rhodomonas_salina.2
MGSRLRRKQLRPALETAAMRRRHRQNRGFVAWNFHTQKQICGVRCGTRHKLFGRSSFVSCNFGSRIGLFGRSSFRSVSAMRWSKAHDDGNRAGGGGVSRGEGVAVRKEIANAELR